MPTRAIEEQLGQAQAQQGQVSTAAASTNAASERHAVTITLSPEAYNHFNRLAKEDDRSLAKFLARKLQRSFESESGRQPNLEFDSPSFGI